LSPYTLKRPIEILLVEDNPADVRLTVEALKEGQVRHRMSVARDGIEAIEMLYAQGRFAQVPRPDIVLLDLNLPRKDGREVLATVKADPSLRSIPVIVLTTSSAEEDIRQCYSLHANCYVTKPVDMEQFIGLVKLIDLFWFQAAQLPVI
jgi:CheY-like chemotaxis protein